MKQKLHILGWTCLGRQVLNFNYRLNPFKKLASQTAIYGIPSIVGRLLSYFLVPIYSYWFPPSDFGVFTEMYAYAAFLLVVLTYGMETALFNFSRLEKEKQKVYSTILISVLTTSAVFLLLFTFFNEQIV